MHKINLQRAEQFEKDWNYWEASRAYEKALNVLSKSSGFESEKKLCKRKIKEMNLKRSETFSTIQTTHEFTTEETKQIQNHIQGILWIENILDLLDTLWRHKIIPSYKSMEAVEMPIMLWLASLSSQDAEGNLLKWWSNPKENWMSTQYWIHEWILLDIYLIPIFQKLFKDNRIDESVMNKYLTQKNWLFTEEFLVIWKTAMNRFFAEDYISFLSVIIPKFEKMFMDLTMVISSNSVDIIAVRNQKNSSQDIWTQDKILSENFLRDDNIIRLWSKDLCEHINYLLFSQLWMKLRHNLSHGTLLIREMNFRNSVLILYLFILIISNIVTERRW